MSVIDPQPCVPSGGGSEFNGFPSFSDFPDPGETNQLYLAEDTGILYRWDGAQYLVVSSTLELGLTSTTAYPGDLGAATAIAVADKAAKTPTVGTQSTSGTINIDLTALNDTLQQWTLTGGATFTFSNSLAGQSVTIRLGALGGPFSLAFTGSWAFVGGAAPTSIAGFKVAVLTITCFANGVLTAAYAVQP